MVVSEVINRVGYIRLNKPPANAYEIDFLGRCLEHVKHLDQSDDSKVVVLQSSLPKFFCGGADIKVFGANSTEENKQMVRKAREVTNTIMESSKIFIAAIQGHALGGGLELALACDLRLAAKGEYWMGLPEIKLGLIPGNGGTVRLIRLIGISKATELLLTGEPVKPEEAEHLGLIDHLHDSETFEDAVIRYAEKLAQGPGTAMAQIKKIGRLSMALNIEKALQLEAALVNELYDTPDAQEGFKAYLEKRNPKFK